MAKIYTRTGDQGETACVGGNRVSKADPLIVCYGLLDSCCVALGYARAETSDAQIDNFLKQIQTYLLIAGPELQKDKNTLFTAESVQELEAVLDALQAELPPLNQFILPAGSETACRIHQARTTVRDLERQLASMQPDAQLNPHFLAWVNRLSDTLFLLARLANIRENRSEESCPNLPLPPLSWEPHEK